MIVWLTQDIVLLVLKVYNAGNVGTRTVPVVKVRFNCRCHNSIHSIEPVVLACKLTVVNYDRQANFERDLLLFRCSSTHSITHSSRSQYASYGVRRRLS